MALGNDLLNERRPLRLAAVRWELRWTQTKQVEQGVDLCSTLMLRHRGRRKSCLGHTHEMVMIHAQKNVENPTVPTPLFRKCTDNLHCTELHVKTSA